MLKSQVTARFDNDFGADLVPRVQITGHPGLTWVDGGIPFRVYPPGCTIKVSAGQVRLDAIRQVSIPGGMLSFNGGNSASLQYAPETTPTFELLWAFDEQGDVLSSDGMSFQVDRRTGTVRCNKSFTGLVKVGEYKASYQLIYYQPETQLLNVLGSQMPAFHVTYGVIAAYKDKGLALQQVDIPQITSATDKIELWRVTSKTVIDPEGEWEYPPTWETTYDGKYADGKTGPDKDSSLVKERIHEIGYMTKSSGAVWYDQFPRALLKPYDNPTTLIKDQDTINFQPQIELKTQPVADQFVQSPSKATAGQLAIDERKMIPKIR